MDHLDEVAKQHAIGKALHTVVSQHACRPHMFRLKSSARAHDHLHM
jgi:hypothetical protein